jgi:dipeptidyl aminopeptidase/acylaminoacyl peptidase
MKVVACFFCVAIEIILAILCTTGNAAEKRPITIEDCIRTRRISPEEVRISPDGTRVAFVVKAASISENSNKFQIFVRDLDTSHRDNGLLLFESDDVINGLRWLKDSNRLALLTEGAGSEIELVSAVTKAKELITRSPRKISSFSINANGDTVAFSVDRPMVDDQIKSERALSGYRIAFGEGLENEAYSNELRRQADIYVARRDPNGTWTAELLNLKTGAPFHHEAQLHLARSLSLSPDGRYLVLEYSSDEVPPGWENNMVAKVLGEAPPVLAAVNLEEKTVRLAFNAPFAGWGVPAVWADDSRAFAVVALSPIGSSWESRDFKEGFKSADQYKSYTHLFSVGTKDGVVSEVLRHPFSWFSPGVISWTAINSTMIVRANADTFVVMRRDDLEWKQADEFHSRSAAMKELGPNSSPATGNARVALSVYETPSAPPDIYLLDYKTGQMSILTDLNPEFRSIDLGKIEEISWKNQYGTDCSGLLIYPTGFRPGVKYPLVIMAKNWERFFLSDTVYGTSFPPQSLANAGFVVLMANEPGPVDLGNRYPGGLGEAFNWVSMIESAIGLLAEKGLAEKANVGLIGFSRTSWKTDFLLTHSTVRLRAASSADGGLYTYGSYWFLNSSSAMGEAERVYGGPPFGPTMQAWVEYAPAFRADRVTSPVLMEYTRDAFPGLEFFVALRRCRKPAEFYLYPEGNHTLSSSTPTQRMASLRRNVDWFRFWMQDYERPKPEDPGQYARWRELRKLQEENEKKSVAPPN